MKPIDLQNSANKQLLAQFSTHLQTLNYSNGTVCSASSGVKEYLHYQEKNDVDFFENPQLANYFDYLQKRPNYRRDGGLSLAYLHKNLDAIKRFYHFLFLTRNVVIPAFPLLEKAKNQPKSLSVKQVEQLFKTCGNTLLGKRDKAILALYYGLGLRRKEGVQLKIEDLNFDKEEVFISQSKTHSQRIVPMSEHVKQILEDYVFNVREKLVPSDKNTASVLVTETGKAMSVGTVSYVVGKLVEKSKIKTLASSHTLRHSIATHLLQSGMSLEDIALFLGHKSLDSTQIYTHLNHENHENI